MWLKEKKKTSDAIQTLVDMQSYMRYQPGTGCFKQNPRCQL